MTGVPRLANSVVLVTGAGRGIGRAIAVRCAAEGASLALAGRSIGELDGVAAEIRSSGRDALVVPADVRDAASTAEMSARVQAELGRVDVLVANSGVAGPTAPLWEVSPEEWDNTLAVNVRGVFLCCRAVLPEMIARGSGNVVVVGSMTGKRPLLHRTPYAASKAALIGLVRSLAADLGPHGLRANLVSPGPVAGPRLDQVLEGQSRATKRPVEELRQELANNAPLRRLLEPNDVASAVVYLASEEARGTTGEDLNVSAGLTMY